MLVGVDGSEDAMGALVSAIALFGNRIGRLTIATVLDFALEKTSAGRHEQTLAAEMLATHAQVAGELLGREVETTMLHGRPADALVQHTLDANYDLIVVSPAGKAHHAYFSAASHPSLARGAGVPVVILPPANLSTRGTMP